MDAIFRGILLSNYNSDFKELLLRESVLKAAVKPETPPYACHEIFRIIFDVVGKCRIESDVKLAHQVFYSWVEHHSDHLREFLTDEIRASYLTDDTYQNKLEVLMLMFETLQRTMNDPVKASAIVQTHAIDLLRRDDMLNIAVPLTGVWENITLSSVSANCTVTLTKAMIRCLGRCHWPVNQRTLFSFVRDVQRVSNFIGMQWNKMSEADVKMCLMEVYAILSSDDGSNKFVCLAFLSPFVKTSFLEEMTKLMILDSRSSSSTLQRVFERVTDWLRWPAKNVDRVIISIMKILESAKHYSVLVQVTKAKIEQVNV